MPGSARVTGSLLDVSACLLKAQARGEAVHGWAIMKETRRAGPTVYGVLDRLEDWDWIAGRWEDQGPEANGPRRRLYELTPQGLERIRHLVAARRPEVLRDLGDRARGGVAPRLAAGGLA